MSQILYPTDEEPIAEAMDLEKELDDALVELGKTKMRLTAVENDLDSVVKWGAGLITTLGVALLLETAFIFPTLFAGAVG